MNTHTLPKFELGQVQDIKPIEVDLPDGLQPGSIRIANVYEPYSELVPEARRKEIIEEEIALDEMSRKAKENGEWDRAPGLAYNLNGKDRKVSGHGPAMESFYGSKSKIFQDWGELAIPSAFALSALAHPVVGQEVLGSQGQILGALDEHSAEWFAYGTDGIAIRTRAAVLAHLVSESLNDNPELGNGPWMSVACGTAIPTLQVARANDVKPPLTLVDSDRSVLDGVTRMAEELGIGNGFDKVVGNVFDEAFMGEKLQHHMREKWGQKVKIADGMGIFEYIGSQLAMLGVDTKVEDFLRWNYDLLADDGRFIFGQMLDSRPRPDFTFGAVGWPFVVTRSLQEIMQTVVKAGIDPKNSHVVLSNPGVYAVVAVDKK